MFPFSRLLFLGGGICLKKIFQESPGKGVFLCIKQRLPIDSRDGGGGGGSGNEEQA